MDEKYRKPENSAQKVGRIVFGALFGAILGGLGGALLAVSLGGSEAQLVGAFIGALLLGIHEGVLESRRRKGEPRPPATQILPDVFFGAIVGWVISRVFPGQTVLVYSVMLGLLRGLLGLQFPKLAIGLGVGVVLGALLQLFFPSAPAEAVGLVIWPGVRVFWMLLIKEEQLVVLIGDQVPPDEARYVVPFEANSKYVGIDYLKDLARTEAGSFKRNPPGIGLIDSVDVLVGPTFNPAELAPEIVDFYEHTSEYTLSIVPEWDWRYRPLFWLFKRYLAQPIGQANLPFNTNEAQRGIVSYIDAIDFSCDDIIDLRGWIRAYKDSLEAIYVGIYTTVRQAGAGYISVGFPLPDASFSATLQPRNHNGSNLLLSSRDQDGAFTGHYLTTIDKETGDLAVVKLSTLDEEIEVSADGGELSVSHRFFLSGLNFLVLHYSITKNHPEPA